MLRNVSINDVLEMVSPLRLMSPLINKYSSRQIKFLPIRLVSMSLFPQCESVNY